MVRDEPAFAAELGPELTRRVEKEARAMCNHASLDETGQPCTCDTDGGSCVAFGLYGHKAHAAIRNADRRKVAVIVGQPTLGQALLQTLLRREAKRDR